MNSVTALTDYTVLATHSLPTPSTEFSEHTRLKDTTQIEHLFNYHQKIDRFTASSFTGMSKAISYSNSLPDLPGIPLTRGFTEPTAEIDLAELKEKIKHMEQTEMTLAKNYGFPVQSGTIDSDDVFRRAEMLGDAKSSRVLSQLRKHRAKIANIERYLATRPPSPAIPAGMDSDRTTQFNIDGFQTWAVIIGVDAYENPRDSLHGCVSDALNFQDYLVKDLKVPVKQIQLLLSPNPEHMPHTNVVGSTTTDHLHRLIPTRSNIISALVGISKNTKIGRGDNIIIFFSGHGTCYPCSIYFKDTIRGLGTVEALCPMDRGSTIPDISDREINIILKQICRSKGHRITVFLDCCHSASATRRPSQGARTTFALEEFLGKDMLQAAADMQRTDADGISVRSPKWRPDMTTHVVVAACKEYEVAKEGQGDDGKSEGLFTTALLRTLRSGKLTPRSTYVDLGNVLPKWAYQTPVVAGKNITERLWFQK